MACHNLDVLFWALRVAEAKQFTVECLSQTPGDDEMYPTDNILRWTIPARGDMPEVKIHAYDNRGNMPEIMKEVRRSTASSSASARCTSADKGLMRSQGTAGGWQFIPYERGKKFPKPPKTLPRAHGGPIGDLLYVMKNGGTPCSDFVTAAGPLASFALTGHMAMLPGRARGSSGTLPRWTAPTCRRPTSSPAASIVPAGNSRFGSNLRQRLVLNNFDGRQHVFQGTSPSTSWAGAKM